MNTLNNKVNTVYGYLRKFLIINICLCLVKKMTIVGAQIMGHKEWGCIP